MESLQSAINRLESAEKALGNFLATFYMPWEGEEPMNAAERAARDKLRDHGMALKQEVVNAQKELISVAKRAVDQFWTERDN